MNKGFVFTGTAFLLVLPAIILAASFMNMLELGGHATSAAIHGDVLFYAYDSIQSSLNKSSYDLVAMFGDDANEIQDRLRNLWKPSIEGNYSKQLGINIALGDIYVKKEGGLIKISGSQTNTSAGIWVNITTEDSEITLTRRMGALWIPY
ncbi:MAG: hypothetical protein QME59_01450 [Candidatus Hydrothermarchaeota archaeon]|nr:hypothetical protein [Candidatus Hydrothermarchaeota archaeon]